jgi:hypothetical protein
VQVEGDVGLETERSRLPELTQQLDERGAELAGALLPLVVVPDLHVDVHTVEQPHGDDGPQPGKRWCRVVDPSLVAAEGSDRHAVRVCPLHDGAQPRQLRGAL